MGPVYSKGVFGGFGAFLDGLIANNALYLKVYRDNLGEFESLGLQAFSYKAKGKPMKLSYYQASEESTDDAELLTQWGNSGFGAAL
ncbi:MAG: TfoX/Sxy family transcriptional regulator of competence genes [Pseudohongiellaceae bacterium]|jgi:TfoX/Sxy family transcriptional regulator of competence genes